MRALGYGQGYRYAHTDYAAGGATGNLPPPERLEDYLPERLRDRAYFEPGTQGEEAKLVPWIAQRRRAVPNRKGAANADRNDVRGRKDSPTDKGTTK